jgi:hypothetical protein
MTPRLRAGAAQIIQDGRWGREYSATALNCARQDKERRHDHTAATLRVG